MIKAMTTAILCSGLLVVAAPAWAIDHKNLDENRPLRLEDAYPIASGEIAVEAGGGFRLVRRGADQGFFPVEILYGALPNLQVGIGSARDEQCAFSEAQVGLQTSALIGLGLILLVITVGLNVVARFLVWRASGAFREGGW